MNKIASIEKIISVKNHPNADRLDIVKVLGYQCVTERGLYKENDIIIYIQPDSVLPKDAEWADSYRKYSPVRIKACKFRGEWSEGIIVKFEQLKGWFITNKLVNGIEEFINGEGLGVAGVEGFDVADLLDIKHYEPVLPQDLAVKSSLPNGIPKTDEDRWENIVNRLPIGFPVDITLKIDGQSWSAYYDIDKKEFGILGRTLEYKEEAHNRYTAQIERYNIKEKLIDFCTANNVSLCIRGESYGEGIQSFSQNPHSKQKPGLAIFSVWIIKERRYARPGDPFYFPLVCKALDIPTVPILETNVILTQDLINKYSFELNQIDGKPFEGVVVNHGKYSLQQEIKTIELPDGSTKTIGGGLIDYAPSSFKIINKSYDSNK